MKMISAELILQVYDDATLSDIASSIEQAIVDVDPARIETRLFFVNVSEMREL